MLPQYRLMQRLDDWSAMRDYLSYDYQGQNGCLKTFMQMLLKGQPHHDRLQVSSQHNLQVGVVILLCWLLHL